MFAVCIRDSMEEIGVLILKICIRTLCMYVYMYVKYIQYRLITRDYLHIALQLFRLLGNCETIKTTGTTKKERSSERVT